MINIGVIGCGHWGKNIIRNFQALKGCRVKMAADLLLANLKDVKELYPGIITTQNYQDILRDPEIEAVAVVTPAVTHYRLIKESLGAQKHVFSEKPLTVNLAQGEELVRLARTKRKILLVGHIFEYNQSVRKIKEILKKNDLGRLLFIDCSKVSLGPIRSDVSVIWDFAFHDISVLTYILGKNPLKVSAWGGSFLKKGLEDFGFINLEFPNHLSAHIRVGWLYPVKERKMTIIGSKRMLVYDDLNKEKPLSIYNYDQDKWKILDAVHPQVAQAEPLGIECQHFLDCIEKNTTPLTDGRRGVAIIKILKAVQQSLDFQGKTIHVPK